MPYMSPEDRAILTGPQDICSKCKQRQHKLYCNICDEFWYVCGCPPEKDAAGAFYKSDHSNCRRG